MCCAWLAGNAEPKKSPSHNFVGLYLRKEGTHRQSEKKLVKHSISSTSSQYGELQPTSWDQLASLGHPCKFQRVLRLGSVTARHSKIWMLTVLRRWMLQKTALFLCYKWPRTEAHTQIANDTCCLFIVVSSSHNTDTEPLLFKWYVKG